MRPPTLALLAALLPAAAWADCSSEATQTDLNACTADAFTAADAELNTLYRQMRDRLSDDADTAHLLTLSQRAWVAWRDAECNFSAASVAGGSIYPMIVHQCLTDLTTARTADFQRYLACPEGDLSCPLPPQ